ncbi:MAG: T9SS type B sorting domain-containing protein [Algibacter sp.]
MFTNYSKNYLLFLLIICIGFKGFSQLSKTHYIPPLTFANESNATPADQYIYLSTPSAADVPYTITPVGQTTNFTGVVSNNNPATISIGSGSGQLFIPSIQTSTITNNKGYIIEAESTVYVSIRANAGSQAGALVSKGLSALGTTFRIGSFTNESSGNDYLSFVSVMATEDDTQVSFNNLPPGLIIENYTGTTPINITLNKSESYTIAVKSDVSVTNRDGLIGALVESNKSIVVNCGSTNGSFGTGGGRDYGIDQIVDLSKVGTEYIFVRGNGNDSWENILIVPHTYPTDIFVNGSTTPITITAANRYTVIEGNNYTTSGNMYIETSQPVFAYQGVGGLGNNGSASEANQGMFFVPPLSCEARGNLDNIALINNIGSINYAGGVSIVTKTGATVTINNTAIGSFSTIGPSTVNGKTDYVTYKVTGLTGNISVQSTDELYAAYFNYNGAATSGSFYSGFPSAPEINFDAQFATLGNCIPNVTLEAANTENFDSFKWEFDDGTGFQDLMITTPNLTPTFPATYRLIGIITCTGDELKSVEIPVSLCPDDSDNDGIIDNIDIDNDNDGILNCTESKGNVTINIANTSSPQLIFQDASTNSSIVSGVFSQTSSSGGTNDFIGDSNGNFTSTVDSASDAEGEYTLSFTELINFSFSENTATPHNNTDGEFFIAKISPANKNITLVDPDNRLLVDTNFDGVFETGVAITSGSEIHFKINPSPTGNTEYQFLANQVDGFSFIHKLANVNASSTFNGTLSLTCYKNDNDSDGIEDAFDLDSDNDGIPDFIENTGILQPLSGIDADLNGLDDIYDINALPIDTDNDLVPDYYDLDSDNDGITDLIETGQLGLLFSDTDLNGIEDGPSYGLNGWVDAAETTPDSNDIGYTLNDMDTDTIFSYIDSDSDGDGCSDVIEAGFSDTNNDDYLGDTTVTVDTNGLVTSATDGYTLPNTDYSTAAPIEITTQPIDTTICEASDTTISIAIAAFDSIQWEVSTDGINWLVITDGPIYSGSQTTDLTITVAPTSINNYSYRTLINRNGNSCDFYSDEITLTVSDLPIANTAPTIRLCDDDNNGTVSFDLTIQNSAISTIAGRTITYHATQTEANAGTPVISGLFESGNTTIYARVENDVNTSCYATSSFDLEVYETPFPLDAPNVTPIQECDNTSVGTDIDGFIIFDLTQRATEILNGQSATDFTLTYFTDASRLTSSEITTPLTYPNTITGGQTIYVRVTNNLYNTCFADTSFEIEVYELPQVSNPNTYTQCDDDSNDGQAFFNLTLDSIKAEINPNYTTEGFIFTYYDDLNEANNNGITISDPANYESVLNSVFIRIENQNGCSRVVTLPLSVSPSSADLHSYNPPSIYQCDDGTDIRDGISTFDLLDINDHISNVIFLGFNVSVHFYESQTDAELETNEIIDINNHQNTNSPNSQSIWVRVKSDLGNDCLGLEEFPNLLIVEALPTANPVNITRECDFDTSDSLLNFPFDTSQLEADILNGQNPADVTITYFDSNGAPLLYSDGRTVTSPFESVFLTENQTITVTVTNNVTLDADGPCSDSTTIEFIIDEQPIANPITIAAVCDGDDDDIDDDGLYPFDLSSVQNTILGTQNTMEIYFNYIDETGNTITNATTIPDTLISGNQTITVEVINPINTSCTDTTSFDLIVNPLPDFSVDSPRIVCTSDPTFSIDLNVDKASVIDFFTYEWLWTSLDGTITDQFISNDESISVSAPGTYSITLTKTDGTGCPRTREILVEASEKATITQDDVTIIDISKNNSVTIDTTTLGSGNYEFALSEEGSNFITYQDEPFFENVKAGFYTIYVNDPICGFETLPISVIGHAKYFTPNGDGDNDYWLIKGIGASVQPNSNIIIYDRYGKLLKQISPLSPGWDGVFNGQNMPSDDYWFRVLLQDGREFMGHFALKR